MSANFHNTLAFVATVHSGQTDKQGDPYILHVLRVMLSQRSEIGRIIALLHDVVEDTPTTLEDLNQHYAPAIVKGVDYLTKREGETYDQYIDRICGAPLEIRRIKMADLHDNLDPNRLERLPESLQQHFRMKYEPALNKLLATLTEEELRS